jgi:putative membrane protein
MLGVILSALHVLALALGLGAVVARGRGLKRVGAGDLGAVQGVLTADGLWGLAAGLWAATGLLRAFGGIEKSPDFYLNNGFFWLKMALFGLILLLEVYPMVTLIGWRMALKRGAPIDTRSVARLVRLNDLEIVLVVFIPFVAAAMARGLWLFA